MSTNFTAADIVGGMPRRKGPAAPDKLLLQELDTVIQEMKKLEQGYRELKETLGQMREDPKVTPEQIVAIEQKIDDYDKRHRELDELFKRNKQKHSAYNPYTVQPTKPSYVEDILKQVVQPNPPDEELFIGAKPDPKQHVVEAIFDRRRIVQEAQRQNTHVAPEKLTRIADVIFNDGFSLERIQQLSLMEAGNELVDAVKNTFEDAGIGTPTIEDVEAMTAVCRAILHHVMTHHGEQYRSRDLKTPFIAWRIKETISEWLLAEMHNKGLVVSKVLPDGYDNRKQSEQFVNNFAATELVLWNCDIWAMAIRGNDQFEGTPLCEDILNMALPMFWQFEKLLILDKMNELLALPNHECIGFCILPTTQDATEIKPDGPVSFARRGVAVTILFMPFDATKGTIQIRTLRPIYEGDKIRGSLSCAIMAAVKFLAEKFVAKDRVDISKKELKADRQLFKKVRKGKVQVPPIKVINLRRAETKRKTKERTDGRPKRQYSCHFMVDSHWKRQWYPSLGVHKPKYILAYPKGDFTKPFKPPREKIYKAIR